MSRDRFSTGSDRSGTPGSQVGDPSLRLPPIVLEPGVARPSSVVSGRSMHQLQLEMEYDVEESDNDSDIPSAHGWPGILSRDATAFPGDAGDLAAREIHALCVFDAITVPPAAQPRSPLIDALGRLPTRRQWGRWRWRQQPAFSESRVAEAIMMYERGVEQATPQRCNRCCAGQGISPQCVVGPDELNNGREPGPCSNCHYDGVGHSCNASGRSTPVSAGRSRSSEPMGDAEKVIDHLAVLEMIARLKRPPGTRRDNSLATRARRIEAAALQIAQAAREWGEKAAKDG